MDIAKVDRNFSDCPVDEDGFLYRNVTESPFVLEGLPWFQTNGGHFYRLPETFTEKDVNAGALELSHHTSGVCVRFRSDSSELQIRAILAHSCDMNHMPRAGSMGFDSYCRVRGEEYIYNKTVQPSPGQVDVKAVCGINPAGGICEWIINFPLYGGVSKVEIGLKEGSVILPPIPHKTANPILFYGSSITQGGCASRPGNCYSSMLCRKLDAEQINLGFSGSGKGEQAVADAIASLKLSVFVMDYDHNAPNIEHLTATHEPFFRTIRKAQPNLPVLMLSRCDFEHDPNNSRRREVIRSTYMRAAEAGDHNVYFIDGELLFGKKMRDACTVDGCHPNDLGFYRMYKHILPVLKQILKKNSDKEDSE